MGFHSPLIIAGLTREGWWLIIPEIRPAISWGKRGIGGVPLDSHEFRKGNGKSLI